jgi:hypothetical protein
MVHTHNNPLSTVTVNNDGTETWKNFDHTEFIRGTVLTTITGNITPEVSSVLGLTMLGDPNV